MSTIQMWRIGDEIGPIDERFSADRPSIPVVLGGDMAYPLHNLDRPVVANESTTTDEVTQVTGNVMSNDFANTPMRVVAVGGLPAGVGATVAGSTGGLFTIDVDGAYTFDPNDEFGLSGEDTATTSVDYYVSDGTACQKGVISVTVTAYVANVDDEYWDYVKLLINPNGEDGSTSFADSSDIARSITPYGDVQIDTALGYASILFDGSGDYLSTLNDTALNFLSDGTIEAFFKPSGAKSTYVIFSKLYNSAGYMLYANDGYLRFMYFRAGGTVEYAQGPTSIGTSEYHVAVVRNGGVVYVYLNGVLELQKTLTYELTSTSVGFIVGRSHSYTSMDFEGHILGIRFTPDIARYTGSFTPPTRPFPVPA